MMVSNLRVKEFGGLNKLLSICINNCWMINMWWKIFNVCGFIGFFYFLLNLFEWGLDVLNFDLKFV